MLYALLKSLHVTCVVLSGGGFFLRGLLMLRESPMMRARWVRIVPHVVDTLLLASAIGLVFVTGQYPLERGWVTAKLLGLLAYIGLGIVGLRMGRTKVIRTASWAAALVTFGYIVSVAVTRDSRGFIMWL
ncbi:MAG: SirB2 family protein [Hyphomicrobiaceae bacterium]